MINVVSIKFKNRGKNYYFDPNGVELHAGDKAVVETSNGLELADCVRGPHPVPDEAVVPPLRPVLRAATPGDLRAAENNAAREAEAMRVCKRKIAEHQLDMKLIDAECNFEGTKTTFYFTSEGRVDFRDLVKDLAGVFHNRIELRQIGVRDEAKMLGGIGLCGRPYCCHQYMDDFRPVSTKMAKVQNLSLNPTKISGSCGRLMCCLRYEQEAYEDLTRHVPRQGSFVETVDGYGIAVQVNLLRQTVKVRLDSDGQDDSLHSYTAKQVAQVPGGRPKEGEEPPHVLHYVEEEAEENEVLPESSTGGWDDPAETPAAAAAPIREEETRGHGRSRNRHKARADRNGEKGAEENKTEPNTQKDRQPRPPKERRDGKSGQNGAAEQPGKNEKKNGGEQGEYQAVKVEVRRSRGHRRSGSGRHGEGAERPEAKGGAPAEEKRAPKAPKEPRPAGSGAQAAEGGENTGTRHSGHRRHRGHGGQKNTAPKGPTE